MDRLIVPVLSLVVAIAFYAYKAHRSRGAAPARTPRPAGRGKQSAGSVRLGFVPPERLDADRDQPADPRDGAVRAAVRAGDWQAAATYLAEAGGDWQERYHRAGQLAAEAAKDDAWLLAWRQAHPHDPGAALVNADALIDLAWAIRGNGLGSTVGEESARRFHEVLHRARQACAEAQALGGGDPSPYIVEMALAMGLGYPHERMRELWAETEKRDPYHLGAYTRALQYWCAKWRGSHEESFAFAATAASRAYPGSLLTLLPLYAHFEYETSQDDLDPDEYYKRPEIVAAVDACLADVAAAPPHNRRVPQVRHFLAWCLYWQDRYPEAVEQFRLIDGYAGATPWDYASDPVKRYTEIRDYCADRVVEAGV
ncbi:hypothetical protein SRB5_50340 [Streptomyces sp. RB5]|uniref:DUF4034 domain-containing protein n=1 Tax=Streptomyces smaragdinus TaxID=2585196 RepID=A0A7K0CMZ8_9ACTN|nr:hypothetical protein [Streptomyces smaragdinus]MQY14858.1 hypothetical protein [Streptomyces smaragdinus]